MLLGIVNQSTIDGQRIRFRPDEYEIASKGKLSLKYDYSVFLGALFLNYFFDSDMRTIILSSAEPLSKDFRICIESKYKTAMEKTESQ